MNILEECLQCNILLVVISSAFNFSAVLLEQVKEGSLSSHDRLNFFYHPQYDLAIR